MKLRTITGPADQIDGDLEQPSISVQVLTLLEDLKTRCALVEGVAAAEAFRASVTGVCLDDDGIVTCVEINGVKDRTSWIASWINTRIVRGPQSSKGKEALEFRTHEEIRRSVAGLRRA